MEDLLYNSNEVKRIVSVGNIEIGGDKKVIISGSCTFGSYEELKSIVTELKKYGVEIIRGGAFKSRTNPNSFQGLQDEGMKILKRIKKEFSVKIIVELMTIDQLKKYADDIDIIQIGSRNMYNYDLLKEVGKLNKPILLKRGLNATYKEWLMSAEYILKGGNNNIILCERGIRASIQEETRNVLDIQAVPYIKNNFRFPIIIDPSHASGKAYMVESMSKASLIAGADGLIIESHIKPESSLCDAEQTINMRTLKNIVDFNERMINNEN